MPPLTGSWREAGTAATHKILLLKNAQRLPFFLPLRWEAASRLP